MLEAILFDFDGVLADTMQDNLRAWRAVLGKRGISFPPEEYFLLEGMKMTEVARRLTQSHGVLEADYESIVVEKDGYYKENNTFRLYPGVRELLGALRLKGTRLALVTAGRLPRLQASCPPDFLAMFEVVITGDKTERGKPFPDPYLAASKALGVAADSCLVIENAPLGIDSAKGAGMRCVAITSTLSEDKLARADWVISGIKELAWTPPLINIFHDYNKNAI